MHSSYCYTKSNLYTWVLKPRRYRDENKVISVLRQTYDIQMTRNKKKIRTFLAQWNRATENLAQKLSGARANHKGN